MVAQTGDRGLVRPDEMMHEDIGGVPEGQAGAILESAAFSRICERLYSDCARFARLLAAQRTRMKLTGASNSYLTLIGQRRRAAP